MSDEKNEKLTEQEVNQVLNTFNFLEFANTYRSTYYNSSFFTPDTVNQQMKNINMNPIESTIKGIECALNNPKSSEQILRSYSQSTELHNMLYKRLIRYYSDMLSFNMTFVPINAMKEKDFESKAFKDDLRKLEDFCAKFDFKEEFSTVVRQLLRQGVFYSVFRSEGEKYTLQELPADYCKITGRHPYGLLFDFDMNWFICNYGVDINMYPKVFKKMYRDVYGRLTRDKDYIPSRPVDKRNSTFVYWHQCSPADGFWCWKIDPEIATLVPYFAPLFPDFNFEPIVRNLQNDRYFIDASKIIVGILGMNKDTKSGQTANQFAVTPDTLAQFMGVARQGLNTQIGLLALPVDDVKSVDFSTSDNNISSDYTTNVSKKSTASSDILFSDSKLNTHQSKLASAVDMNFAASMYPMFANFVEYFVNQITDRYKFKIEFHDANIPDDKTERQNRFKMLASMGIVDIQQIARINDMNVFDLSKSLSMSKTFDLEGKLLPLISLNNQSSSSSSGTGEVGRPAKPDSDNDNTQAGIAAGTNLDRA